MTAESKNGSSSGNGPRRVHIWRRGEEYLTEGVFAGILGWSYGGYRCARAVCTGNEDRERGTLQKSAFIQLGLCRIHSISKHLLEMDVRNDNSRD